jgi:hypothetical protein
MIKMILMTSGLFFYSISSFAQSLSPNILPAGKSIVGLILDSTGKDITSQYSLSYSGTALKLTPFAGKSVLLGSIVGNYNIVGTNISDCS